MTTEGTHVAHCCAAHGCKYAKQDCPVVLLSAVQGQPCPYCEPLDDESVQFAVQFFDRVSGEWYTPGMEWFSDVAGCVGRFRRVLGMATPGQRLRMAERRVSPDRGFADTGMLTSKES